MFSYPIAVLPPFNMNVMDRICGESDWPNGDHSLFMTMTTLFYKRMPNFKLFNKVYNTHFDSYEEHMKCGPIDALSFYWFPVDEDPEPKLKEEHENFDKHSMFLTKRCGQNIYLKIYNQKTIAVFYQYFDLKLYHSVQALIYILLHGHFDEAPMSQTEKNLVVGLTDSSGVTYKQEIQKLLEDEELKKFLLRSELIGMEKKLRERKYQDALSRSMQYLDDMHNYLESYREACEKKNEAEALANGLLLRLDEAEEDTEFEEYLCANKRLTDIKISEGKISYTVKTFVNPYLPDEWECLSRRGQIFKNHSRVGNCLDNEDNLKLLLDAVFSREHCLKLRICGYITLDYFGTHVSSKTGYDFVTNNPTMVNYVPNAHLHRHNCFGQNMDDLLACLQDGDLISAVECSINVVQRMNVAESASFSPFVDYIKTCRGKCIVTDDGQELTPVEAVKYLKEKNNEATSDTVGEAVVA